MIPNIEFLYYDFLLSLANITCHEIHYENMTCIALELLEILLLIL